VIAVVVLDIEGTTSPTAYVTTTLFPYARQRFGAYLGEHGAEPRVRGLLDDVARELGHADATVDAAIAALERWTDEDRKVTPLKTLQGWIWTDGFARGDLVAPFFADVVPALRRWQAHGRALVVFSSGSVDAQHAWFGHSPDGDLRPLISAWFDTANAGPKRERASYAAITAAVARPVDETLFLSDVAAELDAARATGWRTVGVVRPGEPAATSGVGDHRAIASFAELGDLADVTEPSDGAPRH
jgi:enolase-phosphatase E1